MPCLEIDTNVAQEKITPEFVKEITQLLSEILNLDTKFFAVAVRPNPLMMWAGTADPCAVCRLTAINNINEEANRRHSEQLFQFMADKLGIPGDRMYVLFLSPAATHVGHRGKIFSDLKK